MHNFVSLNEYGYSPQIYKIRWEKLFKNLPDNSIVIIASGDNIYRNNDVEYDFRPHSHFYYLAGFLESNAVLCLIKSTNKIHSLLFALTKNESQEIWHGIRCGFTQAGEYLGVDISYNIEDIHNIMPLI